MDDQSLTIQSIDKIQQSTYEEFSCGDEDLDVYLHRKAWQNHKKGIGKTFVLLQEERVIGFYTISMGYIEFQNVPKNFKAGIPKYPVPVARIGRLAIDSRYQRKKLGGVLLMNALKRILEAARTVAAYAVIVDAKNELAKKFYGRFGFVSYKGEPLSLYLSMTTVAELFE